MQVFVRLFHCLRLPVLPGDEQSERMTSDWVMVMFRSRTATFHSIL